MRINQLITYINLNNKIYIIRILDKYVLGYISTFNQTNIIFMKICRY